MSVSRKFKFIRRGAQPKWLYVRPYKNTTNCIFHFHRLNLKRFFFCGRTQFAPMEKPIFCKRTHPQMHR